MMPLCRAQRRSVRERGSTLVEFLAVLPFALSFVMLLWQLVLAAYCLVMAEASVRDAARSASARTATAAVTAIAEQNAAGMLIGLTVDSDSITAAGTTVPVVKVKGSFQVPMLVPWVDPIVIERTVVMPLEPEVS